MSECIPTNEISVKNYETVLREVDTDQDGCLNRAEIDRYLESDVSIEQVNDELRDKYRKKFGTTQNPKLSFSLGIQAPLSFSSPLHLVGSPIVPMEDYERVLDDYPLETGHLFSFSLAAEFAYFPPFGGGMDHAHAQWVDGNSLGVA